MISFAHLSNIKLINIIHQLVKILHKEFIKLLYFPRKILQLKYDQCLCCSYFSSYASRIPILIRMIYTFHNRGTDSRVSLCPGLRCIECSIILKGLNDCLSLQHFPARRSGYKYRKIELEFSNISDFYSGNSNI